MIVPTSSSDAFNLVAIGAWNAAIFSPEWAKKNIADDQERDVILAIPMQMGLAPRLTVDGVNIYPSLQAIVFDCAVFGGDAVDSCVRKFHKISELLPHTPISAVGVNFRYFGSLLESELLAELFAFGDAGKIDAGVFSLSSAVIRRTFNLAGGGTLNLSIDSLPDQLKIEFNFHDEVSTLAEAAEKTTVERVRTIREQSVKFLSEVYGIELDG